MNYVKFGNTGMDVSPVCFGCMSFGDVSKWTHEWLLGEEDCRMFVKKAIELGINFFDTANIYAAGTSEEFLGRAIKDFAKRDEVVIATKVFFTPNQAPNSNGLSRKAIMREIDNSLTRLGMDYVDLYIIHRWDYKTPIEETMEALHDVVKAGKTRYIGASAMYAWQFQKAQYTAEKHNWTKFVSMQNHYNLLYREEEREMMPLCIDQNIASTPYSPLASGRLTRDWADNTKRYETDKVARGKYDSTKDTDKVIVDRVAEIASKHGVPRSHIALSWVMHKKPVVAPIVGTTKLSHIEDAVAALSVKLTVDEMACLEEPYIPHKVVGAL
jgi:1-deoxyxylulose-5-phosphate synthase